LITCSWHWWYRLKKNRKTRLCCKETIICSLLYRHFLAYVHVYLYGTLNYCMIKCVHRENRLHFLPYRCFYRKYNINWFYFVILRKSLSTVHSVIDILYVHHKQPLTLLMFFVLNFWKIESIALYKTFVWQTNTIFYLRMVLIMNDFNFNHKHC
jgi:hypothetical protein